MILWENHLSFARREGDYVATVAEGIGEQLVVWEELASRGGRLAMLRAKVPGGWLIYAADGYHHHGGITFYPDPEHRWNGSSLSSDSA